MTPRTFFRRPAVRGTWIAVLAVVAVSGVGQPAAATAAADHRSTGHHGTFLVWTQYDAVGTGRIMLADSTGRNARAISHPPVGGEDIDPQVSPDGTRVLFERDLPAEGSADIRVVRTDGTGERLLNLGCTAPCAADLMPNWTPNGRGLTWTAVVGPFDPETGDAHSALLWTAELDGSHRRQLSRPGLELQRCEEYGAQYAPAGYLVWSRLCSGLGITVVRRDTNGRERLLTPWSLGADLPDISPATEGPTKDLVVVETAGSGEPGEPSAAVATVPATCRDQSDCARHIRYLTSPTSKPDQHFNPAWSPTGRQIAYTRFISGTETRPPLGDIWTMNWNGTDKRPVVTSPLFDFVPEWGRR
ncbi:TolB family protein [Kribbella endophytica]